MNQVATGIPGSLHNSFRSSAGVNYFLDYLETISTDALRCDPKRTVGKFLYLYCRSVCGPVKCSLHSGLLSVAYSSVLDGFFYCGLSAIRNFTKLKRPVRYVRSYARRYGGTGEISRITIATGSTMVLDSSGSCVLRRAPPAERLIGS